MHQELKSKFKVYLNSTDYTECEPKQTTKRKSADKQFVFCLNEIWGYSEVIIIKKKKIRQNIIAILFDIYSAKRSWY